MSKCLCLKDYSAFRTDLWQNMIKNSSEADRLLLFKKTQKLLDRFLFIFFAEDGGLLPPNSISKILKHWELLKQEDAYKPLYEIFNQYFGYINTGRKGQTAAEDIFAYNGGLFLPDEVLDKILIDDDVLHKHVLQLTNYDFQSEVDVNILGHIFENSLNEIENIAAGLEGQEVDKSKTRRKKDGVFYTPKYITKYIVDNTIGKLCTEKKAEIGIVDEEFAKGRKNRKTDILKRLDEQLKAYRGRLLSITICDPACGSGAFLNQALEFLIKEHTYIDALETQLLGYDFKFPGAENHILEKNIFGVDINEESVEIAKLSLWLRTAQRGRTLTTLNNNIKCGNSLIDDPAVAGEKAFNWKKEFPSVFEERVAPAGTLVKSGGFDVVIGNPPWGASLTVENKEFLKKKFNLIDSSTPNSYSYFMGLCYNLSDNIGIVIPDSFLLKDFEKTRILFRNSTEKIVWYQNSSMPEEIRPFGQVDHDVVAVIFNKKYFYEKLELSLRYYTEGLLLEKSFTKLKNEIIEKKYDSIYNLTLDEEVARIKNKLIKLDVLGSYAQVHEGIHSGNIRDKLFLKSPKSKNEKPLFIGGKNGDIIQNYFSLRSGWFVDYRNEIIDKSKNEYASLREETIFSLPKVYITRTGNPFKCFIDEDNYASNNFFSLQAKDINKNSLELLSVFVCILNSKFAQFYIRKFIAPRLGSAFIETKITHLLKLPLPKQYFEYAISFREKVKETVLNRKAFMNFIKVFVEYCIEKFQIRPVCQSNLDHWPELDFKEFLKELKKAKVQITLAEEAEWMQYFNQQKQKANELKTEINRVDAEIDKMVYELYELTEEEIRIVEGE